MRILPGFFIASTFAVLALSVVGCSWEPKESNLKGKSVRVQVPFAVDGSYRLDVIELFTLEDVTSLKGLAARFLLDPLTSKGQLTGRPPEIRYIRDRSGNIVAKDSQSLQLLTLYAHMEKLKSLDEQSGAANILSYPRTIAVNARLRSQRGIDENNAMYSGQYDALLIEPYTESALPLMANAGAIGHEHFHALFQKLVIEPLKGKYPDPSRPTIHDEKKMQTEMGLIVPDEISAGIEKTPSSLNEETVSTEEKSLRILYHSVLLRGINEGLADIWGWVYSGDNSFVGRSLPQFKAMRSLDKSPGIISQKEEILHEVREFSNFEDLKERAILEGLSYQFGTQLARTLRNFSNAYADRKKMGQGQVRPEMGRLLIASLPKLRQRIESMKDDEYLTLNDVIDTFLQQVSDLQPSDCFFLVDLIPPDRRQKMAVGSKCTTPEQEMKEATDKMESPEIEPKVPVRGRIPLRPSIDGKG